MAPLTPRLTERFGSKRMVAVGLTTSAIGLLILATVTQSSGYPRVLVGLVVMALGIAMGMVPATDSIMGSLPPEKAGVGSAMNDTTREIGGALGVAILGSIFSSAYATHIAASLAGLPAATAAAATSSVGAALAIGAKIGGAQGAEIAASARSSFIHAMDRGLLVGAAIALLGAVVALVWLPNRASDADSIELGVERRKGELATVVERAE
jgi:MFS family permease